eukprot:scaffold3980_cov163-Isochrysis_galbana.AAC.4
MVTQTIKLDPGAMKDVVFCDITRKQQAKMLWLPNRPTWRPNRVQLSCQTNVHMSHVARWFWEPPEWEISVQRKAVMLGCRLLPSSSSS